MGRPGIQMWTWKLCVLSWMCVGQAVAGPQYMVAIPAILESGAETKFCASLLQPSETLEMSVTLMSQEKNTILLKKSSSKEFHTCTEFKVPLVQDEMVQNFVVEVRGNTFYSKEVRKVKIKVYRPMTFIQTEKPIYLPGQTVHFRVITLDTKLRPVNQLVSDSNSNRIGQWLNETSNSKILQLSYALNSEAREGAYQVTVSIGLDKIQHSFKVEKYVLPKFDLQINASDEVSINREEIKAEVCATYTYGQPVPGSVDFKVCRPLDAYVGIPLVITREHPEGIPEIPMPCYKETKQTDKRGCATFIFTMSTFTKIDQKVLRDVLQLSANMEEEGTGISRSQEKTTVISYVVGKLSFTDTPKIYNKGSNVEGKVSAFGLHFNVILYTVQLKQSRWLQNLTTDSDGVATFSLSTADFKGDIHLQVSDTPTLGYPPYRTPYYDSKDHTVSLATLSSPDTKTVSFLDVKKKDEPLSCDKEEDISIQYTVVGEAQGFMDVMYLVSVNEGKVSFKLTVSPDMAPDVQVVAYAILPSETVIANSADFSTEKCFSQKVSLRRTKTCGKGCSCQILGAESKCLLPFLEGGGKKSRLSMEDIFWIYNFEPNLSFQIFQLLPVTKLSYIPYDIEDSVECLPVRPKRDVLPYPNGMKMATNLDIREPSCLKYKGREYYQGHREVMAAGFPVPEGAGAPNMPSPDISPLVTVRTFFPETWIWDLVEVGESGTKDVSLTVPDTITTWETEAFCLSPQGFGLAPRKNITVFQPFFLELSLPYSIIRGEHFELKATTFNYLTSCIMVTVTPTPSLDYTLTPLSGDQYTSCLCGSERKTLSWTMAPSVLGVVNVSVTAEAVTSQISCDNEIVSVPERGRIDVVTRPLIVKAEGTEMTKTYNWLLCPKGKALTEEMDIQLPENVIDGSARASVSVLGDILGRALKNLDGLLQMPYGCGEQNMALLAPNIYILEYLRNTQQLTPAIREKATNFLTSGYQRQLNYKDKDGAYSTFGAGPGNTWLTAFVLRSFSKAQSFIYIDPANIEASVTWLKSKQRKNGCFEQSGKLFNNRMKGGVSDEVTLSAYITAGPAVHGPVIASLSCLKESISDLSNTYTTALLAYVFTLARDMETRAHLLKHLDAVGLQEGGFLHWSQTATETSASLSVEISSYVLLAKLSASPTVEDLGYASRIVRWLTSQQNYYGGFSSTQDTVVALQALALYSTLVFSLKGSSTVTVQSPSGQLMFDVNQNNKLLYQEKQLQDVTGKYSLEVKGTACAISLVYNIPTPADVTALSVEVKPEADCTSKRPKLSLNLTSLYSGKESSTNMVILDIKMLSGFVPDPESLNMLKRALLVDRVEQKEDHVLVYIRELPKNIGINHSLKLIQEHQVENLKPAVVKIYDYYQPSDQSDTEYINPCVAGKDL
uniref:Alpha-2-macroglobulin-like n=1 Tax=Sander lucioperca TaxID=283035 RepID=A0A8C9XPJ5_SANLU